MNHALWLLMKLRLRGWARRMGKNLQTIKGILLTAFFGLLMLMWLGGMLVNALFSTRTRQTVNPEHVERFGPLIMCGYCIAVVIFSGPVPLSFTPAEVQFLFTGPFSRRQLLTYKLLTLFLLTLPMSIFVTIMGRQLMGSFATGIVGAVLVFGFLQLFGVAMALIVSTLGEIVYSRARRIVLLLFVLLVVAAIAVGYFSSGAADNPIATLLRIEQGPVVQYGLEPFRWYIRTVTSSGFDSRFLLNATGAFAMNMVLLGLIYALDARYLEASAVSSEKRYAMMEQLRRGGITGMTVPSNKPIRWRLPDPPWLGGIGPIAWRQLIAATRNRQAVGILVFSTFMACIGPAIAMFVNKKGFDTALPWTLAGMGMFMSLMLNQTLAFDFRADVDRIEVLKSLPIAAWRISIGQLIAPTVYASLYQLFLLIAVYLAFGKIEVLLFFAVFLVWPVNLLLVGIDNLFFLLFPARMGPATPGDFSHAGRQMLLFLGKGVGILFGLGLPAIFAAVTYQFSGHNWFATFIAAMVPTCIICALPIPLIAMAFNKFDVARDTPA